MISAPFVSEKSDWAKNWDFWGFQQLWDSTKMSNFFADKFFFPSSIFFRTLFFHFFREKNPTFFQNLKNIGIFKNTKNDFFWTRNSSSKIFVFFILENPNIFQISKKCWIFFRKKCAKFFWTRKNNFFVGENFWNFCGISEHVETP